MNKRLLYILITSICISLAGIVAVQWFWINNAYKVRDAQFSRSVNEALGAVVGKIEARENMINISRKFEGDSIMRIVQAFSQDTASRLRNRFDSLLAANDEPMTGAIPPPPPPPPDKPIDAIHRPHNAVIQYSYRINSGPVTSTQDTVELQVEEFFRHMEEMPEPGLVFNWDDQTAVLDSLTASGQVFHEGFGFPDAFRPEGSPQGEVIIETPGSAGPQIYRYQIPEFNSPSVNMIKEKKRRDARMREREQHLQKLDNKARRIQDVIRQMAIALETKPAPVQQRINKKSLQEMLARSFREKGITLPFEYAVVSPSADTNHTPIKSTGYSPANGQADHRVSLFPNDLFGKPDMLVVYFPGQRSHVIKSLSLLLLGSILFTVIIILTSGGSIVVMIRQKKISDIKTDFINNMTHEFKTPIATISIAADSINNPKVIAEPETIRNFTRIIKEENNRMNTRVEQVLQMALLDSRDFRLKPGLVDMNAMIERAAGHYRLQVEKRDGVLLTRLEATESTIMADEDHIRNVVMNLLDNANKYSLARPEIEVFTFNRSGKLFFGVQDRGMGMSADAQRRVFDKFYRVTSGNIHNIKGFGLGLSYVRAIVLAHHGEIRVDSEPGKGSRFEISLPVVNTSRQEEAPASTS